VVLLKAEEIINTALLAAFRRLPAAWKPEAVRAAKRWAQRGRVAPRFVGEEGPEGDAG
jgi:hypothetical protein